MIALGEGGRDRRAFLSLTASAIAAGSIPSIAAHAAPRADAGLVPGRDQPFDTGWRFFRGEGAGFEANNLDDSGWRLVDLPHDWSIEDVPGSPPGAIGPFDKSAIGGTATGFTVGGEGWYRKRFRINDLQAIKRLEIMFDGIATVADIWVNGVPAGSHVHAYTPVLLDLTPHLVTGENLIAVRARNIGQNSRWYAGSGLYRQVRLDVFAHSARIGRWDVVAHTRRITEGVATVDVTTHLEDLPAGFVVRTRLRAAAGTVVAEASTSAIADTRQSLQVSKAVLWSPQTPTLYRLESELIRGSDVVDHMVQQFGIRIVEIDASRGLTINGVHHRLRGGCVHHDNGLLGAATFPEAEERRVLLLKARGFNAIRSAHNPASRAFRESCDRHGMLLIEEAFDAWQAGKLPEDYHLYFRDHWEDDLAAMVRSARNSPSVIMWSIGNEIPERASEEGIRYSWELANAVHHLDPTRPVTAAIHAFPGRPVVPDKTTARAGTGGVAGPSGSVFLDVVGFNYRLHDIEADHARYPEQIYYASETYAHDTWDYEQLASRAPYFLGDFVWTAMDYIGEAGIGMSKPVPVSSPPSFLAAQFPWVLANCGDIDLVGEQTGQSRARDVYWGLSALEVAVQRPLAEGMREDMSLWGWSDEHPSWTWPGHEGQKALVRIYTSGDRVELLLDGRTVAASAVQASDKMRIELPVTYMPGSLEVIAFRRDIPIARQRLATAGAPAALRVIAERDRPHAGRSSLAYIKVEVVDKAGQRVPDSTTVVDVALNGPAELIGFGSANPRGVGSFQARRAHAFDGRALIILRSTGETGRVRIEARSDSLRGGSTTIMFV